MDPIGYLLVFMLALAPAIAHEHQGYYAIAFALYCGAYAIAQAIRSKQ